MQSEHLQLLLRLLATTHYNSRAHPHTRCTTSRTRSSTHCSDRSPELSQIRGSLHPVAHNSSLSRQQCTGLERVLAAEGRWPAHTYRRYIEATKIPP